VEVSGRLHTPIALLLGNEAPIPIAQEAGWGPERV
jgi:hypothetical protein